MKILSSLPSPLQSPAIQRHVLDEKTVTLATKKIQPPISRKTSPTTFQFALKIVRIEFEQSEEIHSAPSPQAIPSRSVGDSAPAITSVKVMNVNNGKSQPVRRMAARLNQELR